MAIEDASIEKAALLVLPSTSTSDRLDQKVMVKLAEQCREADYWGEDFTLMLYLSSFCFLEVP